MLADSGILLGCTRVEGKWCACWYTESGKLQSFYSYLWEPPFPTRPGTPLANIGGRIVPTGEPGSQLEAIISKAVPWIWEKDAFRVLYTNGKTRYFRVWRARGIFKTAVRWFPGAQALGLPPVPNHKLPRRLVLDPGAYPHVQKSIVETTFDLELGPPSGGAHYRWWSPEVSRGGRKPEESAMRLKYNGNSAQYEDVEPPKVLPKGSVLVLLTSDHDKNTPLLDPETLNSVRFHYAKIGSILRVGPAQDILDARCYDSALQPLNRCLNRATL